MPLLLDDQSIIYVIYCGIALGTLVAFTGLAQMLSRRENRGEARSRRMRMIAEGRTTAELLALLKPPERHGLLNRLPFIGDLPKQLHRAGLRLSPFQFLAACSALAFVVFAASIGKLGVELAAGAAALAGLVLPPVLVRARCRQQTEALVKQLPDALEMMARSLKVGHPLNNSIGAVAREMPDPIATEFGIVFDQVTFGDDLPEAFQDFATRVDLEDVNYLSASIGIQHGTGGDLANVIEVLARVIRNRISMRRKIRAISSEGRATAWFLSVLPLVMFGFTSMTSPDYYGSVADDPLFLPMGAVVITLTVLNLLILKKLVEFRI